MSDQAVLITAEEAARPALEKMGTVTEQVAAVVLHAVDVLGSKETVMHWLRGPIIALADARPIDLLASGDPAKITQVDEVLYRIEYGMFS